ncbi:polymer-forming cytoskeletal protein [Fibrobacterota bacterium]
MLLVSCLSFASSTIIVNQCETEDAIKNETASFDKDYLYMGKSLTFSGEAEDLVFLGKSLEFSGKTRLGLLAAGKQLLLTGTAGNGIIAGCKDMVIEGDITGTNYIGCKKLLISDSAQITGDVFAGCGDLTIDGTIKGNVYIGAGKVTINNEINGDVKVYGGRIIISENGKINGNLMYGTKEKLTESELARVSGEVHYDESKKCGDEDNFPFGALAAFKIIFSLLLILSFIIVGVILLFLPVFKKIEIDRTPKTFWRTALWGLIPIFMYPAVFVLSIIMGITIPFAIILILAFLPLLFVAYIIGTTMAGQFIAKKFKWNVQKRHYLFLIGALASAVLSIIPVIDFLVVVLLSSLGWGVFISFLFNKSFGDAESAKTDLPETKVSVEE